MLAYGDPWASPLGYQLDPVQREPICAALNSAILGKQTVRLYLTVIITSWMSLMLVEDGKPSLDVSKILGCSRDVLEEVKPAVNRKLIITTV